jgi:pentatricopeptide repeat protein
MRKDQSEFSNGEELTTLFNKEGEGTIEPTIIKTNNQPIDVNYIYHDPRTSNSNHTQEELLYPKLQISQENTTNNLIMETIQCSTRINRESLISCLSQLDQETFTKHYPELLNLFHKKGKIFPLVYYLTTNDLLQDLTKFMHEINPLEFEDYEDCLFLISEYFSSSKNSEKTKNPQRIDVVFNVIINNLCKGKLHDSWIPMLSITVRKLTRNQMNQAISLINFMICYQIEIFTQAINFLFEELGKVLVIDELIKLFEKMLVFSAKFQFHSKSSFSLTRMNLNSGVDYSTFIIVIRILCKTSSLQLAKNYYFLLKSNKMIKDDSIFQIFIESCSKNNKIEEIKGFYNEMLYSLRPSLTTFNIIIEAFVKSKNIDAAWKVYFDMIQGGHEPDSFTYTALFKGIKETSHLPFLNKAFDIIESFVQKKEKFDIIIINVLIDSCFSLKELEFAECLFDKVISLYFNVEPDIITYNTYIKGCAQNAYFEKALEAFDKIPSEVVPNDVTVNTMIDICVRIGNHEKKQEFINLLGQYEIKPDNFTYSTIIKGMNKKNNTLSEAFQLFETAKKYSKADEILYNCIMDACLRFGEIDKMLDVFEEMKRVYYSLNLVRN